MGYLCGEEHGDTSAIPANTVNSLPTPTSTAVTTSVFPNAQQFSIERFTNIQATNVSFNSGSTACPIEEGERMMRPLMAASPLRADRRGPSQIGTANRTTEHSDTAFRLALRVELHRYNTCRLNTFCTATQGLFLIPPLPNEDRY
jgi:hypothetical protein